MSSGVGAMYDDHKDYLRLCEAMGEEPVGGLPLASYKEWDAHWQKMKKEAPCTCGGGRLHDPHCPKYWV